MSIPLQLNLTKGPRKQQELPEAVVICRAVTYSKLSIKSLTRYALAGQCSCTTAPAVLHPVPACL